MLAVNEVHCLDALTGLRQLNAESIDCVMTSPPYWGTRDYGVPATRWPDGTKAVLGLEKNIETYIRHLLDVFDVVWQVLKPTGTLWINIGDTYCGSWGNYSRQRSKNAFPPSNQTESAWKRPGAADGNFRPPSSHQQTVPLRSLCLVPERLALAMVDRGWVLRNRICWHKPNGMPESVKNRLRSTWEHLLFFSKQPSNYYFDLDAIREPHKSLENVKSKPRSSQRTRRKSPSMCGHQLPPLPGEPNARHVKGKNPGDFWSLATETRRQGAILGASKAVRVRGGSGWTGHPGGGQARVIRERDPRWLTPKGKNPGDAWSLCTSGSSFRHFAMYPESLCERPIKAGCPESGVVLDPFAGSGTTCVVAKRLGRQFIGFELNPEYVEVARRRLLPAEKK